jgi:hypothetical protein
VAGQVCREANEMEPPACRRRCYEIDIAQEREESLRSVRAVLCNKLEISRVSTACDSRLLI